MFDVARDFFMNHKSTKGSVQEFLNRLSDANKKLNDKQQKIIIDNIQHMFRKWHYSSIMPESSVSPANIINTQIEREFGVGLMVVPTITPSYSEDKFEQFTIGVAICGREEHYVVRDLLTLLDAMTPDAGVDEEGMLLEEERPKLNGEIFIYDDHYIDFLTHLGWELGLIRKLPSIGGQRVQTSPSSKNFLNLRAEEKLDKIIGAAITISSKELTEIFPVDFAPFSSRKIEALLKKPKDIDSIFQEVFSPMGIDIIAMARKVEDGSAPGEEEKMLALIQYTLGVNFDMWFLTIFGYYLQLIQPIYTYMYQIKDEIDGVLTAVKENVETSIVAFSPSAWYDLTPLGEAIFLKGKRSKRLQEDLSKDDDEDLARRIFVGSLYADPHKYDEEFYEFEYGKRRGRKKSAQ